MNGETSGERFARVARGRRTMTTTRTIEEGSKGAEQTRAAGGPGRSQTALNFAPFSPGFRGNRSVSIDHRTSVANTEAETSRVDEEAQVTMFC
jgi:hypothetical protein